MTARESFKFAFLARCVELGLDHAGMVSAVKQANDKFAGLLGDVAGIGTGGMKDVAHIGQKAIMPAVLGPPILGALGGYALARGTDIDDTAIADVKDRELLDTYQTETAKLQRQKAMRSQRASLLHPHGRHNY